MSFQVSIDIHALHMRYLHSGLDTAPKNSVNMQSLVLKLRDGLRGDWNLLPR